MVITLQVFFILSSIYILSLKSINGQVSIHFFKNWVKYVPVLLSGVIIGSLIYNKINQDLFKKIIYCALIILAVALLIN
jgi:uncharacterized membrane protein YfcA